MFEPDHQGAGVQPHLLQANAAETLEHILQGLGERRHQVLTFQHKVPVPSGEVAPVARQHDILLVRLRAETGGVQPAHHDVPHKFEESRQAGVIRPWRDAGQGRLRPVGEKPRAWGMVVAIKLHLPGLELEQRPTSRIQPLQHDPGAPRFALVLHFQAITEPLVVQSGIHLKCLLLLRCQRVSVEAGKMPASVTLPTPASSCRTPKSTSSTADFPAPLGPISSVNASSFSSKLTRHL